MRVTFRINRQRTWSWHHALASELRCLGFAVRVEAVEGPPVAPSVALVLALERLIRRLPPTSPATLAPDINDSRPDFEGAPDILIDLVADTVSAMPAACRGARTLRVTYDGDGEDALLTALLDDRRPVLALHDSAARGVRIIRPAVEAPHILTVALDGVFARVVDLVVAAVTGRATGACDAPAQPTGPGRGVPGFALASLTASARMRLDRLLSRGPRWFVGWRRPAPGLALRETLTMSAGAWRILPEDGRSFSADPFLIERDGVLHLFVERFDHVKGRGAIAHTTIGPDGPVGPPVPVIEEPWHLSYPFVFAHAGAMYLIPESAAAGTVDLWRAVDFPHRWEKVATLLDRKTGGEAADATLHEIDGQWVMFVSQRGSGALARYASSWDMLALYTAASPLGPFEPHPTSPVVIDVTAARPAGRLFLREGALIRPAQDCSRGYGSGLTLARVDRLDDGGFRQTVLSRLQPGPAWPGLGLHTLDMAGGVEVIDGFGTPPAW